MRQSRTRGRSRIRRASDVNHRRRASRIVERLAACYGTPRLGNKDDPLDELVYILLSQMTTSPSYSRVYDRLDGAVETWDGVLSMRQHRLVSLIADAGLSRQRAPRLKAILRRIRSDLGEVSMDALREMDDQACEEYLTSLPGVGLKTAKCVMMYALGRDVLPADTHVIRVSRRLSLLPPNTPQAQIHPVLEARVRSSDRYAFHVNVVAHGRAVCLAKAPRCAHCCVRRLCPSRDVGQSHVGVPQVRST